MDNLIFFVRKKILSKLDNYFSRSFGAKKLRDRTVSFFNRKTQGNSSYSIISACYNVEKYIDDFVESLVYQTLDFKKNIQLILVDVAIYLAGAT